MLSGLGGLSRHFLRVRIVSGLALSLLVYSDICHNTTFPCLSTPISGSVWGVQLLRSDECSLTFTFSKAKTVTGKAPLSQINPLQAELKSIRQE